MIARRGLLLILQIAAFNEPVIYVPESLKEGAKVNAACTVENINPDGIQASTVWMLGTQVLSNTLLPRLRFQCPPP
ncbi:vascular cell adhesion protein 1-like [Huso huso]|uniref:Vascular cell adhesion protein 1-like n=1 Tax=Huso huso TaxID=61971 RepID=A0ABR0ZHA5_HUSHU